VHLDAVLTKAVRAAKVGVERAPDPLPSVLANEARLVQVFVNLFATIRDAAARALVCVSGSVTESRVHVSIAVTGEHADAVAKALYSSATTEAGGFGLTVCHAILGQIGGVLEVESSPARTVAKVTLPIAEGTAGPRSLKPTEPAPALEKTSVLIVDDEPLVARSLQRLLRKCDTRVAGSGKEAIERIEAGEKFDWILCDLMMPGMSGMDVYAKLSQDHPDLATRIVFVTGGAFTETATRGCRATARASRPAEARFAMTHLFF
jgi:CheY-like chemotaxis protein